MDNDDKGVGTILTRRDAIRAAAVAGVSVVFGGTRLEAAQAGATKSVHLIATPEVEEGPFFVEERLERIDITTGTDRESVVKGSPLTVRMTVYALSANGAEPLKGAHVDVWHADAAGTYSDESPGPVQDENTKGQKWLRGYQVTDSDGKVEFHTIYPGWYHSRTLHIHVKVRTYDAKANKTHEFQTQLFFDEAVNDAMLNRPPYNDRGSRTVRNLWDGLYAMKQADGTMVGSHLHFDVGKSEDGMAREAHYSLALKLA